MKKDLSYSGIVKEIDTDTKKAADLLDSLAKDKERIEKEIVSQMDRLNELRAEKENVVTGVYNVLDHLKKTTPLAVQRENYVVVVTGKDITIERNVL